jgi:hypothetical protein
MAEMGQNEPCHALRRHGRSTSISGHAGPAVGTSGSGRYCCKSRKSPGDNFPAKGRHNRRPSISVLSIALPRSPVSLPSGDEVPHIFTRKSRLQPREFLISGAKRLLQQYRPEPDSCTATNATVDHLVGETEQR